MKKSELKDLLRKIAELASTAAETDVPDMQGDVDAPVCTPNYFRRTQGWDRRTVDQQVLTPLDERSLFATPADQTSIMCYQLPGSITKDGRPILGGVDINASDFAFVGRIYPKLGNAPLPGASCDTDSYGDASEWDEDWDSYATSDFDGDAQHLVPSEV